MATKKTKSHKAMSDSEWISRLRKFANMGTWPADEGNRPAPRQKKWYELYQRIEKCPMQTHGQKSLFGQERKCLCGFHVQKPSTSSVAPRPGGQPTATVGRSDAPAQTAAAAGDPVRGAAVGPPVRGSVGQPTPQVSPVERAIGQQSSSAGPGLEGQKKRPYLSLAMFTKSRFGGALSAAAKPNLSLARKVTKTQTTVTDHTEESTSSSLSVPITASASQGDGRESMPVPSPAAEVATVSTAADSGTEVLASTTHLPRLWSEGLPPEDHKWIEKSILKLGPKGRLQLQDNLKLWYFPPQPSNLYNQAPAPDRFFAHPLFVWMPYKLWKVKVVCPNAACEQHQLTGAGLHKRARRVLDVDRTYNMVTETLTCTKCRVSHVSWSQTVLRQLDLAHRSEFRIILTQKYACDIRVIRLLRERGLGNSPTRVLKQLKENHSEEWLHRVARYTTECVDFQQRPGLLPMTFPEPPEPSVVPSCKWLLSVYSQDIITRLEDIKARITSIYGTILKMDSTKKIVKKLAGTAKGTALWLTSVGNEYGQILISVLTAQEGAGLDMMAADLVKRYQQAGVDPPVALYVDCDCCSSTGETRLKTRFGGWQDLIIRLDIWHFMRRLALGCVTDAHQLYPIFMSRLSSCIFEWDAADLALLREAKKQQLLSQGLTVTDEDINRHLSREELSLHCRRRTRGEVATIQLLEVLLQGLMGTSGNDSLGVPLFDVERMNHIWNVQKKHVRCIQDPPGVALYIKTGELSKGGVRLPTYRCARGSTSLESFHLHLNRFIPGTSANSLNFQVYLLEGLHRWNQDRGSAALSTGPSSFRSYSGDLLHSVNKNYEKLFGRKLVPEFCPPTPYTGELIGLQYLFRQTGQALQDMHPDSEETAQLIEEHNVEEDEEEDEGFAEVAEDPTVVNLEELHTPASLTTSSSLGMSAPSLGSSVSTAHSSTALGSSSTPESGTSFTQAPSTSSTEAPSTSSTQAPDTSTIAPVASAPSTLASAPSSSEAGIDVEHDEEDMAVDEQNVPGYQHVDRLAEFLVELRSQTSLCLTNQQASTIQTLWESLDEHDKQRVVYAARHQERLLSGRFRTPKKPTTTPGVESTTRCMLGASSSPAQWPDCCRLVENIFLRLCNLHPGPVRRGKRADSRWSLILRDYHRIRQLVLGNSLVMEQTEIQLVEVNQNTLIQWHNSRQKKQELSVLLQGTNLPPAISASAEPLQDARVLPALPTPAQQEHQYWLPESTAGQAHQRQRGPSQVQRILPKPTGKRPLTISPPAPGPLLTTQLVTPAGQNVGLVPVVFPVAVLPGTSPQTGAAASMEGVTPKRPYKRTVEANTCKKCGQFRTADTGHSQYYGKVYCPFFETMTKQQWLEEMRKAVPKK